MAYPSWPVSLTDADWQKKKGAIAKIAGETGIGAAMKLAKAAFDKLDFGKMDAMTTLPANRSSEEMVAGQKGAVEYYNKNVVPVRDKVKAIADLAGKTAASWKKNKLIPASSTKAAQAVADDADLFWITLKINSASIEDLLKSWDVIIERNKRVAEDEVKKIAVTIANLKVALAETAKSPTKETWESGNKSAHQRCRSMCNMIKNVPALNKPYWKTWQPYGDNFAKTVVPGEGEAKAVIGLIKTVGTSLKEFESGYKAHLG